MNVVSTTGDNTNESINDVGNNAVDDRLQRSMTAVDEICRVFVESCASLAAETNEMHRMNHFLMLEASFSPELRLIRLTLIRDIGRRTRDVERAAENAEQLAQRVQSLSHRAQKLTFKSRRLNAQARGLRHLGSPSDDTADAPIPGSSTEDDIPAAALALSNLTDESEAALKEAYAVTQDAKTMSDEACQAARDAMSGASALKSAMRVLEAVDGFIIRLDGMKTHARLEVGWALPILN
ncbi:hypothetical protein CYLTODRAFT_495008 [Cylindrobasidium torrendii FP15055 ss-10]|uniref:Uncharacterized protein n=1 Tax=Cylindrobasidium torrendii FP15055 ss-10 TaxID=1314674 RepID=A0A0D7AV19_9AGAR|nr:hypothetical protein CYLTODRAFT_495008 [Cylindrobasidium torrendii FP15055 ss-10]